jgi:hypothetical protein
MFKVGAYYLHKNDLPGKFPEGLIINNLRGRE